MIGFSGLASYRFQKQNSPSRLPLMRGRLPWSDGQSARAAPDGLVVGESFALEGWDCGRQMAIHQEGKKIVTVVGDIYEQIGRLTKAQYLGEICHTQGIPACTQLNGSYLFAIFDGETLYIGTDQNSFIPLYYAVVEGVLYFSWDIAPVLSIMPEGAILEGENLMAWLLFGGRGFADQTRFQGVKRLEPGAYIQFDRAGVHSRKSQPFHFIAEPVRENFLLEEAAEALRQACAVRLANSGRTLFGLSGGLDSRLVLAAAPKTRDSDLLCYTFGVPRFRERDIARKVAEHFHRAHLGVVINSPAYLACAYDGLRYSSGMSIFKHGIQVQLFSTLKEKYAASAVMLGSALDLMLGSTHSPAAVYALKNRSALIDFYQNAKQEGDVKNYLRFNLPLAIWEDLFRDKNAAVRFCANAVDTLTECIGNIPGEHPADINDALAMEIRIRRWYNSNLIFPLLSCRVLTPTYDKNFMAVVARVPWHLRKDSDFRRKLLIHLDQSAADIVHDATMLPAWLPRRYAGRFEKVQQEIDQLKQQVWFDSQRTLYLPSDRFDANFLEWFRVYPEYQRFLQDTLLGERAFLAKQFFKPAAIQRLIADHVNGVKDYQKFLQLLVSAELMARIYLRGDAAETSEPVKFDFDYRP